MTQFTKDPNESQVERLIEHFKMSVLPLEGTFFKNTYTSTMHHGDGPIATTMIGLYAHEPLSQSNFHRLDHDEVWHFYQGDPFLLYLLSEFGSVTEIKMGSDILVGEHVQYVVPAGVWQGACLLPTSTYALFGCTMAPGFTADCFEAAQRDCLISEYPKHVELITKLTTSDFITRLSPGFHSR